MRTIVHLSDLHFGRVDAALIEPLVAIVQSLAPDVVAVSGDLTQRARTVEFEQARAFLDRLPSPQIIVPGNHDVPLYDVVTRFVRPLGRYRRYITRDLEPWYADDELAVVGVNTARSLTFKHGRINEAQITRVEARMRSLREQTIRVVVTHHPLDVAPGSPEGEVVRRAALVRESRWMADCDLLLAGHLHTGSAALGRPQSDDAGGGPVIVQAGTATSTRERRRAQFVQRHRSRAAAVARHALPLARGRSPFRARKERRLRALEWGLEARRRARRRRVVSASAIAWIACAATFVRIGRSAFARGSLWVTVRTPANG